MTQDSKTKLVGHALYLEFRLNEKHSYQMLLTPHYTLWSSHGAPAAEVLPVLFRRQLSESHPKRTWRVSTSSKDWYTHSAPLPSAEVTARTTIVTELFDRLKRAGWELAGEPVVVQVSEEDLRAVHSHKTPYKLMGRVWRARTSAGYPKEFIGPFTPVVPTTPA